MGQGDAIAIFVLILVGFPIILILYSVINFFRKQANRPFIEAELKLHLSLNEIINLLKPLSNNKFKLSFWDDIFFMGFSYSLLHALIRNYAETNEFYFNEKQENEIIMKVMTKIRGKDLNKEVAGNFLKNNDQDAAEGIIIGKEFYGRKYIERNIPKSMEYIEENISQRYINLEDKFEDDASDTIAYKLGQKFKPLHKNNRINKDLEDLEKLFKNKTISEEEYKETRKGILKKYYS